MAPNDQETKPERGTGVEELLTRHGGLTYLEIPAIDPARSAAFYEHVLDWKIEMRGRDDLRFRDATGHLIGRWTTNRAVSRESGLLPYMYVDHIGVAIEQVAARGGEVIRSPYPEGNLWIATVRDPAGNVIGLWQAGTR